MNDDLVKRLDNYIRQLAPHVQEREAGKLLVECRAALTAQQEPVATVTRVSVGNFKPDVIWHKEWPEHMTKLYTAPASGVKEGMMRAAEICKEWEAKLSQGAGYAIRTAREAITRAADQVNAEGRNGARDGSPEWVPEQYRKTAGGQIVGWKSLMCESKGGSDYCMHCGRDMAGYYANRPPCEVLERRRLAMIPDEMVQAFGCRNEAFHAANGGPTEGEVCKKWCKQPCCPVSFKEKP